MIYLLVLIHQVQVWALNVLVRKHYFFKRIRKLTYLTPLTTWITITKNIMDPNSKMELYNLCYVLCVQPFLTVTANKN